MARKKKSEETTSTDTVTKFESLCKVLQEKVDNLSKEIEIYLKERKKWWQFWK